MRKLIKLDVDGVLRDFTQAVYDTLKEIEPEMESPSPSSLTNPGIRNHLFLSEPRTMHNVIII